MTFKLYVLFNWHLSIKDYKTIAIKGNI